MLWVSTRRRGQTYSGPICVWIGAGMALDLERFHGPDPNTVLRAERAFLAVNEVDRIIVTGSGGNLHPFLPLDPFHGVHRAMPGRESARLSSSRTIAPPRGTRTVDTDGRGRSGKCIRTTG